MAKVIITRQNQDGTFDDVGTRNRTILRLKTQRGIIANLKRNKFVRVGDKVRLEWHRLTLQEGPYATTYAKIHHNP